jgi:hypothetical protein
MLRVFDADDENWDLPSPSRSGKHRDRPSPSRVTGEVALVFI